MSSIPLSFGKVLHARFSETGWSGDEGGPRNEGSRIRSRPGYGEKFQALLATIELLALGGGVSTYKICPIWLRQKDRSF